MRVKYWKRFLFESRVPAELVHIQVPWCQNHIAPPISSLIQKMPASLAVPCTVTLGGVRLLPCERNFSGLPGGGAAIYQESIVSFIRGVLSFDMRYQTDFLFALCRILARFTCSIDFYVSLDVN